MEAGSEVRRRRDQVVRSRAEGLSGGGEVEPPRVSRA